MRIANLVAAGAFAIVAATPALGQLVNGSFETPGAGQPDTFASWTEFNNFIDDDSVPTIIQSTDATDGSFSAEFRAGNFAVRPNQIDAGFFADTSIPVSEGDLVEMLYDSKANGTGAVLVSEIQWLNSVGGVISASQLVPFNETQTPSQSTFEELRIEGVAPAGAVAARPLFVHVQLATAGVGVGTTWVIDNIRLQEVVPDVDPVQSFELLGPTALDPWTAFTTGGFIGQVEAPSLGPRSGNNHLKVFGAFNPFITSQGAFQDAPASAGQTWTASAFAFNDAADPIQGGNQGFLNIEFLDSTGAVIEVNELFTMDASTPPVVYDPANPTAGYVPFSQSAVAPVGAATARMVLGFNQDDAFSGGAIYYDDASFSADGGANVLTNPGFEFQEGATTFIGWNENPEFPFGNINPRVDPAFANSFANSAGIFGQFATDELGDPVQTETVLFQDYPTAPGDAWAANGFGRGDTFDPLGGFDDLGFLRLAFLDCDGNILQSNDETLVDFFGPTGFWAEGAIGGPNDSAFDPSRGIAPAGAVTARLIAGFLQVPDLSFPEGFGAGSVFFDDVTLELVSASGNPMIECPTGGCSPADLTTNGATLPGQPGFGVPDQVVDADDLNFFLSAWVAGDAVADLTTNGAPLPGQSGFGVPDPTVDADDLNLFLNFWRQGCP